MRGSMRSRPGSVRGYNTWSRGRASHGQCKQLHVFLALQSPKYLQSLNTVLKSNSQKKLTWGLVLTWGNLVTTGPYILCSPNCLNERVYEGWSMGEWKTHYWDFRALHSFLLCPSAKAIFSHTTLKLYKPQYHLQHNSKQIRSVTVIKVS